MADAINQMPAELAEIIALHREMFEGYSMNAEDINQSQAHAAPANEPARSPSGDGFAPITSQEAFDKAISERLTRERSKFADYDQLKARVTEADNAAKSAEQLFNERLAALEKQTSDARMDATRARIQAHFKLSDEDAELFLTARDEEGLTAQAERLSARLAEAQPKKSNVVPREGRPAGQSSDPLREMARQLFKQS